MESPSRVTIDLDSYSVTVRSKLALALAEIDSPDIIDLIRECEVCQVMFWAGRTDKQACDKHVGQRRKGEQRRREREDHAKAEQEAEESKIKKELEGMSRTAVALLNAIVFDKQYVYWKIDNEAYIYLKQSPLVRRVPNDRIVRRTLQMLVDREYLNHEERSTQREDRYFASKKLLDHQADIPNADTPEELRQDVPIAE